MDMKPSGLAGWLVLVPMLFLSVFYFLISSFLSENAGAAAVLCTGICILIAFGGTKLAVGLSTTLSRAVRPVPYTVSRVFRPFVAWISIASALLCVLLNILLSVFSRAPFWGLSGLYPMLTESIASHRFLTFLMLVLIPSVFEELLLRGTVFPVCGSEGTAAAVFFSALTMPMLFVYPQAVMTGLVIGLMCALVCHMTQSLAAAVWVHFACRFALWLCDIAAAGAGFMRFGGIWSALTLFIFLLCAYRTLRSFEGLLKDDLVAPVVRGSSDAAVNLKNLMLCPGFILFAVLFFIRLISMIVTYA